jgi:glucose/arabinose dehydrogenase
MEESSMVRRILALLVLTGSLVLIPACGNGDGPSSPNNPPPPPGPPPAVSLVPVVTGLSSPIGLESLPDGRLFVIEQPGLIRIIRNGAVVTTPFLDISARLESGGEKGLLGLAFHPSYAQNRRFFAHYTRRVSGQLQTVISEFFASAANPDAADSTSERVLLVVHQPEDNHNGGQIAFGPDGLLFIALGDGGGGGDMHGPQGNGQNLNTLLGKILRIDVNGTSPGLQYRIPSDNPFAAGGGLPEIWAYGFRNPWRFSFDAVGRLFAGDVGQSAREEIDLVTRGGNYGWRIMEGSICFNPMTNCNQTGLTLPIHDYPRSDGATVIGGFVYRGTAIPGLVRFYVFGDFITGRIWALREDGPNVWTRFNLLETSRLISSFGVDHLGEMYVVDYGGTVLRIAAQ